MRELSWKAFWLSRKPSGSATMNAYSGHCCEGGLNSRPMVSVISLSRNAVTPKIAPQANAVASGRNLRGLTRRETLTAGDRGLATPSAGFRSSGSRLLHRL